MPVTRPSHNAELALKRCSRSSHNMAQGAGKNVITADATPPPQEYLPVAKAIALNELLLLHHLCGIPAFKFEVRISQQRSQCRICTAALAGIC